MFYDILVTVRGKGLILAQEHDEVIMLSGNITLERGPRWSAIAISILC